MPRLFLQNSRRSRKDVLSWKLVKAGLFLPLAALVGNCCALTPGFGACGYYRCSLFPKAARGMDLPQTPYGGIALQWFILPCIYFSRNGCTATQRDVLFKIHPDHTSCCFCILPIPGFTTKPSAFSR